MGGRVVPVRTDANPKLTLIPLACTEVRSYVYELLMYLVGVHAQVTSAAAPLLERTLNALVEDIAEEALRCFRQVKRFGMGGMLRVSPVVSLVLHNNNVGGAKHTISSIHCHSFLVKKTELRRRQRSRLSSCIKPSRVT